MKLEQTEYQQARIYKDKAYDGRFYFAVKTTGIFCRPSCPSPVAKEENVLYFDSPFAALERHFVPCYRCRPDITLDFCYQNVEANQCVSQALSLIQNGYLNSHSVVDLASTLKISQRHLRKVFNDTLGTTPNSLAIYHRCIFAKKLLLQTNNTVTNIAFTAGFQSVRQFNDVIKKRFGKSPSDIRKLSATSEQEALKLYYPDTFHFQSWLKATTEKVIPECEVVTDKSYKSTFHHPLADGWFEVSDNPKGHFLNIVIHCDNLQCYMPIYNQIRHMFDLHSDLSRVLPVLRESDADFSDLELAHIPHIPIAFNTFALLCYALLRRTLSEAEVKQHLAILVKSVSNKAENAMEGLSHIFPSTDDILNVDMENSELPDQIRHQLLKAAKAIQTGKLSLLPTQSYQQLYQSISDYCCNDDWVANFVAIFGLGMKDCLLESHSPTGAIPLSDRTGTTIANSDGWKPYRSYGSLCLLARMNSAQD